MGRRGFLTVLAASVVAGASACSTASDKNAPVDVKPLAETPHPISLEPTSATPPPLPPLPRVPLPGGGALTALPDNLNALALTLDDGTNSEVVRAYTQLAIDSGIRLTYFVNGTYSSWTDNKKLLAPLVESGQIQLGNHTWDHPDLTTLSRSDINSQLTRNHRFLTSTFGGDPTPYFRPPYGKYNSSVTAVAADLGYTMPTMWYGSLGDSQELTEGYIVDQAKLYFNAGALVIGHLNHLPVTHTYPALLDVIRSRGLRTVTLNDVFTSRQHP